MLLRKLENKDAMYMLEWMHDKEVVKDLNNNFTDKTLDDCISFINNNDSYNLHLAIVDENDEYQGTVSLKNINSNSKTAEFAITIRKKAMGRGISSKAMKEILSLGFNKLSLENIYWCVNKNNIRAVRFYEKNQYLRCNNVPINIYNNYNKELQNDLIWYVAERAN